MKVANDQLDGNCPTENQYEEPERPQDQPLAEPDPVTHRHLVLSERFSRGPSAAFTGPAGQGAPSVR
jgi:hypothetical protein